MAHHFSKPGLARVVSTPPEQEYLAAQFLGELPPVVPSVLTGELRYAVTKTADRDG